MSTTFSQIKIVAVIFVDQDKDFRQRSTLRNEEFINIKN